MEIRPTDDTVPKIGAVELPTVSCAWMPFLIRLIELSSTVALAIQLDVETMTNAADPEDCDDELPESLPLDPPEPAAADPADPALPLEPPADVLLDPAPGDADPATESPTATSTVATNPEMGDSRVASDRAFCALTTPACAEATCACAADTCARSAVTFAWALVNTARAWARPVAATVSSPVALVPAAVVTAAVAVVTAD